MSLNGEWVWSWTPGVITGLNGVGGCEFPGTLEERKFDDGEVVFL
jgi:hypothetical protein